jgi:predicted lipid-binding transport protein (Tim44 family)
MAGCQDEGKTGSVNPKQRPKQGLSGASMEFFDFGTIFFLVAAVVIFFQLRNVLGRRTGSERPPFDPYSASRKPAADDAEASDNVVALPRKRAQGEPAADVYADIDAFAKPDTYLNKGLRTIKDNDASFEPKGFVDGAKMAYEMIVMAYADGDRKTLKNLLSREVFDGFVAAISEREAKSEKIQSSFVGIDKADIVSAEMKGSEAHVTLRIVSELISATRDKAGTVIDGDPETVAEVKDVWTFARDTRSRDPNWKLVATEEED